MNLLLIGDKMNSEITCYHVDTRHLSYLSENAELYLKFRRIERPSSEYVGLSTSVGQAGEFCPRVSMLSQLDIFAQV
jgi:hypothetical protein